MKKQMFPEPVEIVFLIHFLGTWCLSVLLGSSVVRTALGVTSIIVDVHGDEGGGKLGKGLREEVNWAGG